MVLSAVNRPGVEEVVMAGTPTLVLVGGAAGVGKSTVARRWCELQARAVHIELDRSGR